MSIVYVLTNPAMPSLVKIGCTENEDANTRIAALYSTGVPVPFTIEFAAKVADPYRVEEALHVAFAPYRVNPKREFFRIEPDQAIAILKLLHVEDATVEVASQASGIDEESLAAAAQQRSRRPNLNFAEMGVPIGAVLHSTHNGTQVTVVDDRHVRLGDQLLYLSTATRQVLGTDYPVAPGPHWTYDGRTIREIYEDTYAES